MRFKPYGTTNKNISVIAFGGMRFAEPHQIERSADLLLVAHSLGINYFDTAPFYCDDQSEAIVGHALSQLPRDSYFVSTKSACHDGAGLRAQLERSLERLRVDRVDFFHVWCLMSLEDWERRLSGGAVEAALQAKEDGWVSHLVCSTHMQGQDIERVLDRGIFEGVTLGYNAINFPYRRAALRAAGARRLGVIAMNPLHGGVIPRAPERFQFLGREGDGSVVTGALRFVVGDPDVTAALVGFARREEIAQAVAAIDEFAGYDAGRIEPISRQLEESFDGLCTGCGYCLPCPQQIPVPRYMDAANHLILSQGDTSLVLDRFFWHWNIKTDLAALCSECGECEERCTQHLPIRERLRSLPKPRTS
jgi:uncharacterized protein